MSDIGKSLNAGAEFARGLAASERKTAAYNALRDAYGVDLAGDPDTAIKIQSYRQNELTNPQQVENNELVNEGLRETNAFNVLANPKRLAGLDLTNEGTAATTAENKAQTNRINTLLPGEVEKQAADTRSANASTAASYARTAQTNDEVTASRGARSKQAALGILSALADGAKAGQDVGALFDRYAPIMSKFEGVTPQRMGELRAAIVANPGQAIPQLTAAIQGAGATAPGSSGAAGVSQDTIDYAAQRYRETGEMPKLGAGKHAAAVKGAILARAAEQAKAGGSDGKADLYLQQANKQRQIYLSDLGRSNASSAGGLVRSAGALLEHAHIMDGYIDALGNGNTPLANRLAQEWKRQTGSPIPVQLDQQKTILGDELARYLIARGGTGEDRKALQEPMNKANSPAQLRAAMRTIREDVHGQLIAQRQQAIGVNATDAFDKILTPRTKSLLGIQSAAPKPAPGGVVDYRTYFGGGK